MLVFFTDFICDQIFEFPSMGKGNAMCKGSTPIHFRAGFLLLICSQSQGDAPQDTYKSGIVLLIISTLLWLIEGSYGSLNRFFTAINMQILKKKHNNFQNKIWSYYFFLF